MCSSQPVVPTTMLTPSAAMRFHVRRHGGGNGEIDGHVDAAEVLRRDAFEIGVVELVELERDREAVLRRELLDQPAHLAVADDGRRVQACTASLRSKTSGSSSAKNSRCSASTARAQVRLGHHEAEVQQRRALRDHADVDAVQRVEDARAPRPACSGCSRPPGRRSPGSCSTSTSANCRSSRQDGVERRACCRW